MKKFILAIVAVFTISFSQASTNVDSTSSALTSKAVYNDGKAFFQNMTVGAKNALSTGYDVIVQQQRVIAIQYLVVGLVCLIFIYLFIRFYTKATTGERQKNMLTPAIIFLVLATWSGIVFSLHYSQIVQGLINPDYAAIEQIIDMFQKVKK
jgi:hypothetical protein